MQNTKPRFKRKPNRSLSPRPAAFKPAVSGKKKNKQQDIPHHRFVQAALPLEPGVTPLETRLYVALPLHEQLLKNIAAKGYTKTTPIQDQAIEPVLHGRDVLGIAQTGTGKTAAFLIPLIQQWLTAKDTRPTLVLTPTRELALQVEGEFRELSAGMSLISHCYIGGGNINADIRKLTRFHHLVVGTPGRLLDLVGRRAFDLNNFGTLILDEFDRMLDMGFVNDVRKLTAAMKNRKQTLLFSATIEPSIQEHIDQLLNDPVTVQVNSGVTSAEHIEQDIVRIEHGSDKFVVLENMLHNPEFRKVLVFTESKHRSGKLAMKLVKHGFAADAIHGDKSQSQRQRALESFRTGKVRILVATDVAARGLDISDVTHVINYEAPRTYDSYIHRIGRTGRAGKTGKAFTFVEV